MNWGLVNNIVLEGEGTFDADPMMLLDKVEKARKFRDGYCSKYNELCSTCPYSYKNNKYGTPCKDLTIEELTDIYNELNKEDKNMTNEEALRKEIDETMKQLDILQKKLEEVKNEVPEELIIKDTDEYYYVNDAGNVCMARCALLLSDARRVRKHRAFLSEEYAEDFAKKTQFIADMLHFKYLYDRDYKPDWNDEPAKYFIQFDHSINLFTYDSNVLCEKYSEVYFSSKKIAQKCIDWLNKKYGYTKE